MRRIQDIAWLGGLLEGDGTFTTMRRRTRQGQYPAIRLAMSDEDTIKRAAKVAGVGRVYGPYTRAAGLGNKPMWVWHVQRQADAAGLMMTLYPLMSARRKGRIREVLAAWRGVGALGVAA